jgi:cathepsin B
MRAIIIFTIVAIATAVLIKDDSFDAFMARPIIHKEFVDHLNSKANTWRAGLNEGSTVDGATFNQARALCGTLLEGGRKLPSKTKEHFQAEGFDFMGLPTSFDARKQWPYCPSIQQIRDQSACGSCWAFGAVEAMSDRNCINLPKNLTLSAGNMAFCCDECGDGCNGGFPGDAWQYWVDNGLVEEGCYPYPFPSCDHHLPKSKNPCPSQEYDNPNCPTQCTNTGWNGQPWSSDLHQGKTAYSLDAVQDIMADLMQYGPVEASFEVYEDFLTYKSGVYQYTSGDFVGGHAIKILGWGTESGVDFWLCANSWNPNWGMQGYFKIARGVDECGIEDGVVAGMPAN